MHNLPDVCRNDPQFGWQAYLPEKRAMFDAIVESRGSDEESAIVRDFRSLIEALLAETMPL